MNVGMDEVERLLKRAVSTGAAVVVVILGPGQGAAPPSDRPATSGAVTATVTPVPTPDQASTPDPTPEPGPTPQPGLIPAPRTGHAAEPSRTITTTPLPTTDVSPTTTTHTHSTSTREGDRTRTTGTPRTGRTRTSGTASRTGTPAPDPGGADGTATAATTAAATQGWGTPSRVEDFNAGTDQWQVYDGPGNDGKGRRSPSAIAVRDGVVTLGGDASGTTGGMCRGAGRRYGRWEARVRAPASDPSYHAALLLWPDDDNWPAGGEIDFMELIDPGRRLAESFVHHGADNRTERGTVETDASRWRNWAVEWTPSSITMFLDGRQWYRATGGAVQPPGPMHLCVQLDWFPTGGPVRPSTMQVDWVREYGPDGRSATSGKPAGATGTGGTRTGTAG
jgi:Glycosyl hydrolases family 16